MNNCFVFTFILGTLPTITFGLTTENEGPEQKVILRPDMLVNETAVGDAGPLIDEQELAGDPESGKGGKPSRPFFPGWTDWQYPVSVAIDLGSKHRITRLYFYNETGRNDIRISWGKPFDWKSKSATLEKYRDWVEVPTYLSIPILERKRRGDCSMVPN